MFFHLITPTKKNYVTERIKNIKSFITSEILFKMIDNLAPYLKIERL